ncbi:MAG: hypothetical protein E7370_01210 [Clostridiales bacterium]|nr:hypothetical protein [Clostridiales bacterium]
MKAIVKGFGKIIALFLALFTCFITAYSVCTDAHKSTVCARAETQSEPKRVVGYLPNWSYKAYEDIDFSALTHINIAFCNLNSSGEFYSGIPDEDMYALVNKAHAHGVKIMAALGGGGYGDPYRALIAGTEKINLLNGKLEHFCEKYSLDGIDLDIELASSDSIWNYYGEWVSALRSICNRHGWILSTATAQWVAGTVTAETFALFDFVSVMAYDNDGWNYNSHSSYDFSIECLNYFNIQKEIPKENLVLGVPFYGRGYTSSGALDWNSYLSFKDLISADIENYDRDEYNGIAYNGASTMQKKCELAKEYGGIMIWEITLDAQGEYSLLDLIKQELIPAPKDELQQNDGVKKDEFLVYIIIGVSAIAVIALAVILIAKRIKKR